MIKSVSFKVSPYGVYTAKRNLEKGSLTIAHYGDYVTNDVQKLYKFNKDGSGTAVSKITGAKTSVPAGTFSDVLHSLRFVQNLDEKVSMQLASLYDKTVSKIVKN